MAPDPSRFAALLCDYCLEVRPGQQVHVSSTTLAAPLLLALQRELLEREAWPVLRAELPGAAEAPSAPESEYRSASGDVLVLRGAMTPATRREYAATAAGSPLSREDAWQRAVEFLFERLAVRWEIAGTEAITKQKELLARFRFASADERRWIRDVLREHLAEHFPEMPPP